PDPRIETVDALAAAGARRAYLRALPLEERHQKEPLPMTLRLSRVSLISLACAEWTTSQPRAWQRTNPAKARNSTISKRDERSAAKHEARTSDPASRNPLSPAEEASWR